MAQSPTGEYIESGELPAYERDGMRRERVLDGAAARGQTPGAYANGLGLLEGVDHSWLGPVHLVGGEVARQRTAALQLDLCPQRLIGGSIDHGDAQLASCLVTCRDRIQQIKRPK